MSLLGICEILGLFVTHCLPMISILFVKVSILRNQIKFNYIRNKKIFSYFFTQFLRCISIFERFLVEKDDPHILCISEIRNSKRRG